MITFPSGAAGIRRVQEVRTPCRVQGSALVGCVAKPHVKKEKFKATVLIL